jgi:hypothetical protein
MDLGCSVPNHVGHDVWMVVATGFTPSSSATLDLGGGLSIPWSPFDIFGSNRVYHTADSGTTTISLIDGNGLNASVTVGPAGCSAGSPAFTPKVMAVDLGCNMPPGSSLDTWMLVGTGFSPGSPITLDGASVPYQADSFGSVLVYRNGFPVGVTQTTTVADDSGGHVSVTWGPPTACP